LDGLPVSSKPSSLSRSPDKSSFEPTAGIKIGKHPVASIKALGYLSFTAWITRSLIFRVQAGMPMIGI
jgi:hypothetical protein